MGQIERSIKIAVDQSTGEIVKADDIFDEKKDAFAIRKQYNYKEQKFCCCECGQDLIVSDSKYNRIHFKHKPQHDFCILADGSLSPKDHEGFAKILWAKESERHIELKNKIGQLLETVEGVNKLSISIDNKFIIRGNEKRRPDVYCKFHDKELVFEIQLSDLSQKYILSRYEFYKKYGMYLIWILDNFDIHNQGTLERDIKYLTKYENFFKLDETTDFFKLECEYKFPFITDDNKVLTKWLIKSVSLNQVSFDTIDYQIYYYNFGDNKQKAEAEQKVKAEEIKIAERKKVEEQRIAEANRKSKYIIKTITDCKKSGYKDYNDIASEINALDHFELETLNYELALKTRLREQKPILNYWIHSAKETDNGFILFLLDCKQIELEVNKSDTIGKSAFQEVFENDRLLKNPIIKALFKRGYQLTELDKDYYKQLPKYESENLLIYSMCSNLSDKELVDDVFSHYKLLFIIESARQKTILGSKLNNWVAFANNSIYHHKEYWEYIELAFKKSGLWDIIIQEDKKGTFNKKVNEFYQNIPTQKFDFDEVFRDLYWDLAY
jgi:competence CoiA-like predicted nuclease